MAEKETIILDFQVEQGDALSELEKTKKSIVELKREQQELNKAYKSGNITLDEYAQESVRLEGVLKKQTSNYNTLQKAQSGVVTQFDKLVKANQDLAKSNQKIGDELSKTTGKFNELAGNINIGGTSVSDLTGKLTTFLNPATAVTAAVGTLAGLYLSSAAGARDLESAQDQLSTSFRTISNDLADLLGADGRGGGILSRFASTLNTIVFGQGANIRGNLVAAANQALKDLELLELDARAVAKQALSDAEKLRRIRDDDTKSFAERKKAADEALGFINVREQVLVNAQKERLNNLRILLSFDQNNLELQKAIKQTEFEIRDIREDSEGKRTETLNAINALLKEQTALIPPIVQVNTDLTNSYTGMEKEIIKTISAFDEYKSTIIEVGELEDESIEANKAYQAEIESLSKRKQELKAKELESAIALSAAIIGLGQQENAAARALALTTIAINAGIGVSNAVKSGSGVPFPANLAAILTGITAVLTGIAQARNLLGDVSKAAGGGRFMTKGPTLLMVGDNPGGVERVTVEPISGKGKTKVGKGLIQMAGGGVLETRAATNPINNALAFRQTQTPMVVASWKEATELNNRIQFKEALVTA